MIKNFLIPTILMIILFACKREEVKPEQSLSISEFYNFIHFKYFTCTDTIPHEGETVSVHGYLNTNDFLDLGTRITIIKEDLHTLYPKTLIMNIDSRVGLRDSIQEIVKDDQIRHNYLVVIKVKICSWDDQSPFNDNCTKSVYILVDHFQDIQVTKLD